jgi:hypothetical protein
MRIERPAVTDRIQYLANKSGGGPYVDPYKLDDLTISIATDTGGIISEEAFELRQWLRLGREC